MTSILSELNDCGVHLQEYVDITKLTSFGTQAGARYFLELTSRSDILLLPDILRWTTKHCIPVFFLGGGSNTLFATDCFEGLVILNHSKGKQSLGDNRFSLVSGEMVSSWSIEMTRDGLSTLMPWIGLPGTIGGAVIGNAGCFGLETSDILESAEILDIYTGQVRQYSVEELQYVYRSSLLKSHPELFVVSAVFDLTPPDHEIIDARIHRKTKQPGGRSCGSFFKNPSPQYAGALLEGVGAKGCSCGGVKISESHANFFINDGTATWQQIIALALHVRSLVQHQHSISLHHEVVIVGSHGITNLSHYETSKISLPAVSSIA
ncbi:MAG: UDP-N-acetylmuramate dehydrogenase [Candidatus Gracilibacteria bacterium]